MKNKLSQAILKTISYADIFDYPLNQEEIWKWLIQYNNLNLPSGRQAIQQFIRKIKRIKEIQYKDGYYVLSGRTEIISLRQKREKISRQKLKTAEKIASILSYVPYIKLIAVTGALSMNNTDFDDDIDFLIITKKNPLWTSRFLAVLLLDILNKRRKPKDKNVADKICLNMFIDENYLLLHKEERDLYTAHEVLQMKPLFIRNGLYAKFLNSNKWVEKYVPNAYKEITLANKPKDTSEVARSLPAGRQGLLGWWRNQLIIFEVFFKKFQLWYMRNRRTSEVIKDGFLRFHPQDARTWVMEKYYKRLRQY